MLDIAKGKNTKTVARLIVGLRAPFDTKSRHSVMSFRSTHSAWQF